MRLSENALFPKLFVILKKLSSEYQLHACETPKRPFMDEHYLIVGLS